MSYDEFPDEFAILQRSLENEDFERAESVLLMILKKKSDLQQARIDLEQVRSRLGSIANYEFRVKGFLEQGDLKQATSIINEAKGKFTKNRKIRALIEYFDRVAAEREADTYAARTGAKPDAGPRPSADLPNLETIVGQIPGGAPGGKPAAAAGRPAGAPPQNFGGGFMAGQQGQGSVAPAGTRRTVAAKPNAAQPATSGTQVVEAPAEDPPSGGARGVVLLAWLGLVAMLVLGSLLLLSHATHASMPANADRAATSYEPMASPPALSLHGQWLPTLRLLGMGAAIAWIPGLILGWLIATGAIPYVNRLFEAVWTAWLAFPMTLFAAIGATVLPGMMGAGPLDTGPRMVIIGLAMVPTVAFFAIPGFRDGRGLSDASTRLGLGIVTGVGAILATVGRFVGEGALLLGVVGLTSSDSFATIGRELFVGLLPELAPSIPRAESMSYIAAQVAPSAFFLSAGLVLVGVVIVAVAATVGMKLRKTTSDTNVADSERPDAPQQANVTVGASVVAGVGFLVVAIATVLILVLLRHLGVAENQEGFGNWAGGSARSAGGSMMMLAAGGGVATLLGALMAALIGKVRSRALRLWSDVPLRAAAGIAPVLIVFVLSTLEVSLPLFVVLGVALSPFAGALILHGRDRLWRGPYVPARDGKVPHIGMRQGAMALEVLAVAALMAAIGIGAAAAVLPMGAEAIPAGDPLAALLKLPGSPGLGASIRTTLLPIAGLVGIGLLARLTSEFLLRTALRSRVTPE